MAEQADPWRQTPQAFLSAFKYAIEFHKYELRWGAKDWVGDLADLGLTMQIAVKLVQEELTSEHVHRGPEPDDEVETGRVAIFRLPLSESSAAYVKLGLRPHQQKNFLIPKIWSFKRWRSK